MKTFRTLHYVPKLDGHFLDDAIGIHTFFWNFLRWPQKVKSLVKWYCSHLDIWTPDEVGSYTDGDGNYRGMCWTSTMRGEENGVVVRPASQVLKHPDRWFAIEWKTTNRKYDKAVQWMNDKVNTNQGYGVLTILSFFWIRRKARTIIVNGKEVIQYICSGFVDNAFDILVEATPYRIPSPLRFTLWAVENLKRLGGHLVRL